MANSKLKCTFCKERFRPEEVEGKRTPAGWFCSINHAIEHSRAVRERQNKKAIQSQAKKEKDNRKASRSLKDNDRKHQFKLTKEVIQKWVNHVRDSEFGCISCGTKKPNILYSGGHYRTAGGNPEIALESKNIHKQCLFNCNKNKSGNINGDKHSIGFKKGLIDRCGQKYVDWLESHHESNRLDCDQLRELRAYYNRLIREKKKTDEDRPFF